MPRFEVGYPTVNTNKRENKIGTRSTIKEVFQWQGILSGAKETAALEIKIKSEYKIN
jgi:hypothetical protein